LSAITVRETRKRASPLIAAAGLERPRGTASSYALIVQAWVAGAQRVPDSFRIQYGGQTLREGPFNMPRPDVSASVGVEFEGTTHGFRTGVTLLGLPQELTVSIQVAFGDDYVELWEIDLTRQPLAGGNEGMQPLLLTTLGRTGSSLMMSVLEAHPDVAAHPVWTGPGEMRLLMYWVDVLRTLAAPTRYFNSVVPEKAGQPGWALEDSDRILPRPLDDEGIARALNVDQVEFAADLARRHLSSFYTEIATLSSKAEPRFFAEKFLPVPIVEATAIELYPGARQLVLVRDFRDMVASILAFNAKRARDGFGRQSGQTDEEWVLNLGGAVKLLANAARRPKMPTSVVRYEDLVRTPERVLSRLFDEIGLRRDDDILARMIETVESRSSVSDRHRTVSDAEASIGRWQSDLTPSVQEACQAAFGEALALFDYS
jgi:Sulfotransferase family